MILKNKKIDRNIGRLAEIYQIEEEKVEDLLLNVINQRLSAEGSSTTSHNYYDATQDDFDSLEHNLRSLSSSPPIAKFEAMDVGEGVPNTFVSLSDGLNISSKSLEKGKDSESSISSQSEEEVLEKRESDSSGEKTPEKRSSSEETLSPKGIRRPQAKGGSVTAQGEASTSATRGPTAVGIQVEHSLAYLLLEQLIYSAIEGELVKDIPDKIVETFQDLPLEKEVIAKIKNIASKVVVLVPEEIRRAATKQIRGGNHILKAKDYLKEIITNTRDQIDVPPEELTDFFSKFTREAHLEHLDEIDSGLERITANIDTHPIRQAIRLGNRAHIAPIAKEIMDECIFGANKMEYGSLPTEGVPQNPHTGQEQYARDDLLLLSDFIQNAQKVVALKQAGDQQWSQLFNETIRNVNSLNELQKKWGISLDYINDLMDEATPESFSNKLDSLLTQKVDGVPNLDDLVKYMETIFTQPTDGSNSNKAKKNIDNNILVNADYFEKKWGIFRDDLDFLKKCGRDDNLLNEVRSRVALANSASEEESTKEGELIRKILTAQREAKETVQNKITRRMGQMFYYPHLDREKLSHYTIYDLSNYESNSAEQKEAEKHTQTADWAVSEEDWERRKSRYTKWSKPRNNELEPLYEVAGRAITVMFKDFKGLSSFSEESQEDIVNDFLSKSIIGDKVIEKREDNVIKETIVSGWESSGINLANLKLGIEDCYEIDYTQKTFRSKSSANFLDQSKSAAAGQNLGNGYP